LLGIFPFHPRWARLRKIYSHFLFRLRSRWSTHMWFSPFKDDKDDSHVGKYNWMKWSLSRKSERKKSLLIINFLRQQLQHHFLKWGTKTWALFKPQERDDEKKKGNGWKLCQNFPYEIIRTNPFVEKLSVFPTKISFISNVLLGL
jgi:hypothetical protein